MKRAHIIGGKNHGKTTLLCDLVAEFRSRGLRIGTIKHTHHHHELDTPGKDSHRHREAGAMAVGILSPSMKAVFWPTEPEPTVAADRTDERYDEFTHAFSDCDLVLVEGDTQTDALKLEVWRAVHDAAPISDAVGGVRALITDDPIERPLTILSRFPVTAAADFIQRELGIPTSSQTARESG